MSSERTWACQACTLENPSNHKRCHACSARRPVATNSTPPSSVRAWIQRRHKRKRSPQPTCLVKIQLDGEQWEPLRARLSSSSSYTQSANAGTHDTDNNNKTGAAIEREHQSAETIDHFPSHSIAATTRVGFQQEEHERDATVNIDAQTPSGTSTAVTTQPCPVETNDIVNGKQGNVMKNIVAAERSLHRHENEIVVENAQVAESVSGTQEVATRKQQQESSTTEEQDHENRPGRMDHELQVGGDALWSAKARLREEPSGFDSKQDSPLPLPTKAAHCEDHAEVRNDNDIYCQSDSDCLDMQGDKENLSMENSVLGPKPAQPMASTQTETLSHEAAGHDQNPTSKPVTENANVISHLSLKQPKALSSEHRLDKEEQVESNIQSQTEERPDVTDSSSQYADCSPVDIRVNPIDGNDSRQNGERLATEGHYQDMEERGASSQDGSVDIGFSQLMSQEPSGFLYTQMSQEDSDCTPFPLANAAVETTEKHLGHFQSTDESAREPIEPATKKIEGSHCFKLDDVKKPLPDEESNEACSNEMANTYGGNESRIHQPYDQKLDKSDCSLRNSLAIFRAAGTGNKISVTEESMARASSILQDAPVDSAVQSVPDPIGDSARAPKEPEVKPIPMFQTAGKGSFISVSEEGLKHAKSLLQESNPVSAAEGDWKDSHRETEPATAAPPLPASVVFQTAGRRTVISVTEDSLQKAIALFQGVSATDHVDRDGEAAEGGLGRVSLSRPQSMPDFRTTGRKNLVSTTDASLLHAASIRRGTPDSEEEAKLPASDSSSNAATFQTAGQGNVISVSNESLARADGLLKGAFLAELHQTNSSVPSDKPPVSATFQTAGKGAVIDVAEEDMKRAATLFRESSAIDLSNPSAQKVRSTTPVCRLQPEPEFQAARTQFPNNLMAASISHPRRTFQTPSKQGSTIPVLEDDVPNDEDKELALTRSDASIAPEADSKRNDIVLNGFADLNPGAQSKPHKLNLAARLRSPAEKSTCEPNEKEECTRPTLLLHEASSSNVETRVCRPLPVIPASFRTAGKSAAIMVAEDSMAKARSLLEQVPDHGTDSLRAPPSLTPMLRTAEDSIASALLQEPQGKEKPKYPLPSNIPWSSSHSSLKSTYRTTIEEPKSETNGKRAASSLKPVSLAEEADRRESQRMAMARPVSGASHVGVSFQTAGKGAAISVTEASITKATALLEEPAIVGHRTSSKAEPPETSKLSDFTVAFQTAGKGIAMTVSSDEVARATALLQDCRPVGPSMDVGESEESEEFLQPMQAADMAATSKKCIRRHDANISTESSNDISECLLANGANPLVSTAVTRFDEADATSKKQRGERNDLSQDLDKRSLFPETPFLLKRSKEPQEDSLRIRTVAFGLTPQSQPSSDGALIDRQQARKDTLDATLGGMTDNGQPMVTPSIHVGTRKRQSLELTNKIPAFTPKQTPMETSNAVVTMSIDPKHLDQRHHRGRHGQSMNENNAYSPVPIDFQVEGSRGKSISPSSRSCADKCRGEKLDASLSTLPEASTVPNTLANKMVTWSEDHNIWRASRRTTLAEFASKYGKMDDCYENCRDAGVHAVALSVDSTNATRVRFDPGSGLPCSFFGQPCPPGCKSIGSVNDVRGSLVERGCDEKILDDKWILNHCRWIVWKLASTERRFAYSLAQSYLTYDHVITQLLHRYDKELKGGIRSAVRKVLNRDVSPNRMMILCVSQIVRRPKSKDAADNTSKRSEWALELTDGWYSIGGLLDTFLSDLVSKGTIKVGSKLLVCNAKLEGSEDGIDPLDACYSSCGRNCSAALCLFSNGTRLAKWDAKMGFVKPSRITCMNRDTLLVRSISHVIPGGGSVPLIELVVCRRYPLMFLERKITNSPNEMLEKLVGKTPVISEAQEYRNRMHFEKKRQQAMEKLSETVESECSKVRYHSLTIHAVFETSAFID